MATLERIRSKSVFLLVVIFVALLAFVLGDAITNGRNLFGSHTTVAKVGGDKIDYLEYQQKREEMNRQLEEARRQNPDQYASFDVQLLPQMAVNQLVSEKLLAEAVKKMGITTSPELLRRFMLENPQPSSEQMMIVRSLQSMNVNVTSMAQVHDVIFNPKSNKHIHFTLSNTAQAARILELQFKENQFSILDDHNLQVHNLAIPVSGMITAFVENGLEVSEAHTCEESLEDYFKRITGGEGIA